MALRAAALALLCALAGTARADLPPLPPSPARHLTDDAGFLSPATRDALDARLDSYQRQTGHQIVVWIGTTIGAWSLDDWAVRTFAAWKVGRQGKDDGLVLFILAVDRKMDIEVGYGLEDQVPDAKAKQIIEDTLAPGLRAGKPDEAVSAAVEQILALIEGHPVAGAPSGAAPPPQATGRPPSGLSMGRLIVYGIVGLLLLVFIITNPRLALFFLLNFFGGGRGGFGGGGFSGGGFGGGGFSGGGGRSGGGGARGSW